MLHEVAQDTQQRPRAIGIQDLGDLPGRLLDRAMAVLQPVEQLRVTVTAQGLTDGILQLARRQGRLLAPPAPMDEVRRGVERAQDDAPPHLLAGRGLGRGGQVPAQHRTEDAGVAVHLACLAKSPVQPGQLVVGLVALVP